MLVLWYLEENLGWCKHENAPVGSWLVPRPTWETWLVGNFAWSQFCRGSWQHSSLTNLSSCSQLKFSSTWIITSHRALINTKHWYHQAHFLFFLLLSYSLFIGKLPLVSNLPFYITINSIFFTFLFLLLSLLICYLLILSEKGWWVKWVGDEVWQCTAAYFLSCRCIWHQIAEIWNKTFYWTFPLVLSLALIVFHLLFLIIYHILNLLKSL